MATNLLTPPTWVTSDSHLNHLMIREDGYCPWRQEWCTDVDHMNEVLIAAWNKVVGPDDVVLHLGDFSFGDFERVKQTRERLNGHILLTIGNHDRSAKQMAECGFLVTKQYDFAHGSIAYSARHDPTLFNAATIAAGTPLLHGHWHGDKHRDSATRQALVAACGGRLIDCGVDATRVLAPMRIVEVIEGR